MNYLSILLSILLLVALSSCVLGKDTPVVKRNNHPAPVINGLGTDPCWADTTEIPLDTALGGGPAPVEAKASIKITFDDQNLYFFIRCEESDTKSMMPGNKKRDAAIWDDNCVELYFAPSETTPWDYYHIIVNCAGTLTDAIGTGLPTEWNSNGKSAGVIGDKEWTAEVSIPLASLNMFPWTTDKVRFNAIRLRLPKWEYSSIAGVSHKPNQFIEINIPGISSIPAVKNGAAKLLKKELKPCLSHIKKINQTIPVQPRSKQMIELAAEATRIQIALNSYDLHTQALAVKDSKMRLDDMWGLAVTAEKTSSWDIIAVSPMDKFRKDQLPALGSKRISLNAARGEGESAQIVIRPSVDLKTVTAECKPFINSSGYAICPELKMVKYVPIKESNPKSFQITGLYPDPLVDMEPFDVRAFESQGIWLDVWVPRNAPAGKYHGSVVVTCNGKTESIPVTLTVRNVTLAVTPSLKTHVWNLVTNTAPEIPIDVRNRLNMQVLKYRMCTPPTLPWAGVYSQKPDGTWTADWTEFDKVTQSFVTAGCTSFRVESIISWGTVMPEAPKLPEIKAKLTLLAAHLQQKGWMKWFMFYIFDEVPASQLSGVRDICNFIHSVDRDYRVIGTINWHLQDLVGYIDVWVPHLGAYDAAFADKMRARGDESWTYTCIGAVASNYPTTWIIDYYSHSQRALGWWLWDNKCIGYLYWGIDIYWKDPWTDTQLVPPGNGDGVLYYPDPNRPAGTFPYPKIPSIRLTMHRDGFEDYDLFSMLEKAIKANPALKSQYGSLLTAGKTFKKTGVFSTDSSYYEKRHDAVLKALEDLQALSDRNKT